MQKSDELDIHVRSGNGASLLYGPVMKQSFAFVWPDGVTLSRLHGCVEKLAPSVIVRRHCVLFAFIRRPPVMTEVSSKGRNKIDFTELCVFPFLSSVRASRCACSCAISFASYIVFPGWRSVHPAAPRKYHAKAAMKLVLTVGTRNPNGKVVRVFLCNFVCNLYCLPG